MPGKGYFGGFYPSYEDRTPLRKEISLVITQPSSVARPTKVSKTRKFVQTQNLVHISAVKKTPLKATQGQTTKIRKRSGKFRKITQAQSFILKTRRTLLKRFSLVQLSPAIDIKEVKKSRKIQQTQTTKYVRAFGKPYKLAQIQHLALIKTNRKTYKLTQTQGITFIKLKFAPKRFSLTQTALIVEKKKIGKKIFVINTSVAKTTRQTAKTLIVTPQVQKISILRRVSKKLSLITQAQSFKTLSRALKLKRKIEQASSVAYIKRINYKLVVVQVQIIKFARAFSTTLKLTQAQALVIKILDLTKEHFKQEVLKVTQAQTAVISRIFGYSKKIKATQAQTASIKRSLNKILIPIQEIGLKLGKALTIKRQVEQVVELIFVKLKVHTVKLNLTQAQVIKVKKQIGKLLGKIKQASSSTLAKTFIVPLKYIQAQVVTLVRKNPKLRRFTITQAQTVRVVHRFQRIFKIAQAQGLSVIHAIRRLIKVAIVQAQSIEHVHRLNKLLLKSVEVSVSRFSKMKHLNRRFSLKQIQIVRSRPIHAVIFHVVQEQLTSVIGAYKSHIHTEFITLKVAVGNISKIGRGFAKFIRISLPQKIELFGPRTYPAKFPSSGTVTTEIFEELSTSDLGQYEGEIIKTAPGAPDILLFKLGKVQKAKGKSGTTEDPQWN